MRKLILLILPVIQISCTDIWKEKCKYVGKDESGVTETIVFKEKQPGIFLNIESAPDNKSIRSYWRIIGCGSIEFKKIEIGLVNEGNYLNVQKACTVSEELSIRNCKSGIDDLIPDLNNCNNTDSISDINFLVEFNSNGLSDSISVVLNMVYEIGAETDSIEKRLALYYPQKVKVKVPFRFH